MLNERLSRNGIKNLRVLSDKAPEVEWMGLDLAFVSVHFGYDWAHGTGSGVYRLSPTNCKTGSKQELADLSSWQIYNMSTTIDTLLGHDPEKGDQVRYEKPKLIDPLGKARTYNQLRSDEQECLYGFQPDAVIVGKCNQAKQ